MKNSYVKMLIQRKSFVIIACLLVLVAGVFSYLKMPKQNFPEVVLPVASVAAVYPGATAEDMEELVAKPIEETAMTLNGFDSCTTQTYENACAVMIALDMSLDQEAVNESFDDLRLKIESLKNSLPNGVQQITVDTDIMDTAGLLLAVSGEAISGDELSQRTNRLKDQLKLMDGVERVDVLGELTSEITITADTDRLNDMDLSLAELSSAIAAQNSLIPLGNIDIGEDRMSIVSDGKFEGIEEIGNIIIGSDVNTGILYRLADVADIELKVPDDTARYFYNGNPSNIIALYFDSGINVVSMGDSIRETVEEFQKGLPENVSVHEIYFQSDVVNKAVNSFVLNLIESIILVIIVVMVGMGLRNGLVVSLAIPLTVFGNFILMPYLGMEIQFVSLAALIVVLGMMVDNSVVVSDAIQVRLNAGEGRLEAAMNGTGDVAGAVFVSMLTTVAGFAALLTLSGAYKQLAYSLPVVIITCLLLSFIISLFVIPLFSYLLLKPKGGEDGKPDRMLLWYDRMAERLFAGKKKALLIVGVLFAASVVLACVSDFEVVAKADKDVVTIEVTGNYDHNRSKTQELVQDIEAVLQEQPEVLYYVSGVGAGIPRYDYSVLPKGQGDNVGDVFVRIDLAQGGRFEMTRDFVEYIQEELDRRVAGGRMVVDELGVMAFTSKPLEMKVYSDDLEALNEAAALIEEAMREVPGTKNIINANDLATYGYSVDMDSQKLNTLGLMKAEVQNELSIALMGRTISLYRENEKEYNVVLESNISDIPQLKNYKIKGAATGNKYMVQQFADVNLNPGLYSITRLDGERGRAVGCYAKAGYSNISLQSQLEKKIREIDFPEGVRVEKSGEKKEFMNLLSSIITAFLVSFVAIFLILLLQFGYFRKILLVFVSVPFGALGGIAGLTLTGKKLSLFALLGIIALMGCVLANAIVLIEYIDDERKKGSSVHEACRSAGTKRFRPILMSTTTTVLGLFPLAVGGDTLFIPMAILLMFGLTVSMVINLLIVPMAYEYLFRDEEQRKA